MERLPEDERPQEHNFDVKTFLSWTAPGRPFRKKGKDFYLSSLLVVFLVEVALFMFSQFLLMSVVGALYFFALSLASVPPKDFHYRISNQGIKVEDHFYIWEELYDFYFKKIDKTNVLVVRTHVFLPGELRISLGDITMDHVRKILVDYLPYREVVKSTFIEEAGEWLARNFPLERA